MPIISLDRSAEKPLIRQLYEQMQDRILSGIFPEGYKLPSTRLLASELGVSRNVVLEAYDQLIAEGYIESKAGSGTYVAAGATYASREVPQVTGLKSFGYNPSNSGLIDYRSGIPDLGLFPIRLWTQLTRDVYRKATPSQLAYGFPEGRMELREAITDYVRVHRGVQCHPEQILITSGTTQAIGLISRLLLQDANKNVILEDPITNDIRSIILGFGGRIHPVPIDEYGLKTDLLQRLPEPGFIYVTPSHHYPIGVTMPIQRRVDLLKHAVEIGTYLVEDDYDSEFRYDAMPVHSIQGLDPSRVIYVGTFSKTLCPSLRIGYIILPPALIERGRELKWFTDLHNATMDQLVLASFIKQGHFARYVARMKKVQKRKRTVLVAALKATFGDGVNILGSATGLHLAATFPGVVFDETLLTEIESRGVKIYPVEAHAIKPGHYRDTVILGYGMLDIRSIEKGITKLAAGLRLSPQV